MRSITGLLVLALAVALSVGSAAKKKDVRGPAVAEARAACYSLSMTDVYGEVYALLAGKYQIARESEKRGFIETAWKGEAATYGNPGSRTMVSAELVGESCVRVVLRVTAEPAGDLSKMTEDDLYLELHGRLRQRPPKAASEAAPEAPAPASTTAAPGAAAGAEGGPCYGNATCNPGLTCASNLCVRLATPQ